MIRPVPKKSVLVDIDHTLSDAFWRDNLIGAPGGWDAYHKDFVKDEPIREMVDLINVLSQFYNVLAITVRPGKWRGATMRWFVENRVLAAGLLMRADDSFQKAPDVKLALATEHFGSLEAVQQNVAMVFDDREDVCAAFAGIGIVALQVYAHRGRPTHEEK